MIITCVVLFVVVFVTATYWTHASPYSQFFGRFTYQAKTNKKIVALTFDDGPNGVYTSRLLDLLDSENIEATFFVVGKCVAKYPGLTKRIAAGPHIIGNHSYSHEFRQYFRQPSFRREINTAQAAIKFATGLTPNLFRPPWLYRQPALMLTLKNQKMTAVSGIFCHPLEVKQIDANKIAKRAVAKTKHGSILIFHDGYNSVGGKRDATIEAVAIVINRLREQGYTFVTVDKLLGVRPYHH